MAHITKDEWLTQLEACGDDLTQEDVIKLLFDKGPNALWNSTVEKMHDYKPFSTYRFFKSMLPTRVWKDWQGTDELGTQYFPAFIPFNLQIFQRSMQVCDPRSLNECHTDYCEIPRGGIGSLPALEMYKTGFQTQRMCIANIRTSAGAKQVAQMLIDERFQVDERVMDMFYTMAMIRMLGHKWVLEGEVDSNGQMQLIPNSNPYNALRGGRYNYLNPLFPQAGDLNNILPFDFSILDAFGRSLTSSRNPNYIAMGPRNTPVFQLWHTEDWYREEVLTNPEWVEKLKVYMDNRLIPGYTMDAGQSEVIGNFSFRQMPGLPRFAESTEGGLTIVQEHTQVAVESGNRTLHNYREWDNAPFGMAIALGKDVGEILTRPSITTGIEGRPIMPINGNGDWVYRNDYDKDCNKDLNMPFMQKRFEMGFKLKNPEAGWGFLFRNKKFRIRPINTCNLRDTFVIQPQTSDCSILTIGCAPTNDRHPNNFFEQGTSRKILCQAVQCGSSTSYRLTVRRESMDSIAPNQNPLGNCECGDVIRVGINDENNAFVSVVAGTIVDYFPPNMVNPNPSYTVKLESALSTGQCIGFISCDDDTPGVGMVQSCVQYSEDTENLSANQIRVALDSDFDISAGTNNVLLTYKDVDGVVLGTLTVDTISVNHETFVFVFQDPSLECVMYDTQASITVTPV